MKRVWSLFLCLVVLCSICPLEAACAENAVVVTTQTEGYKEDGQFSDSGLQAADGAKGRFCSNPPAKITYTPNLEKTGMYKVYVYVVKNPNQPNAKNVEKCMVTVRHADGKETKEMNFDVLEGWQELGVYKLYNGTHSYVQTAYNEKEENGTLRAGGAKFVLMEEIDEIAPPMEEEPFDGADIIEIPAITEPTDGVTVYVDGMEQTYDQPAIVQEGRTLVPMRGIFEALDATVYWNNDTNTVTALRDNTKIVSTIGDNTAYVNDKPVQLDVAPQLINDRTLVPVRFISESLGAKVDWEEKTQSVLISTGKEARSLYLFGFADFSDLGTWTTDGYAGAFNGTNLRGITETDEQAKPAVLEFSVDETGYYNMFVRTRGFTTQPKDRYFNVSVNGTELPKAFGQHGKADWVWENAGVLHLQKGKTVIQLLDTSRFYARTDAILLTSDENFKDFPTTDEAYAAIKNDGETYDKNVYFPEWASAQNAPTATQSIANDKMKIHFLTVAGSLGNVIQKEVYIGDKKITGRENHLGNLLMYGTEANAIGESSGFHLSEVTYSKKGSLVRNITSDIFHSGKPYWLIPERVEILADNKAALYASCDVADSVSVWELKAGESEPTITFTLYPKVQGAFSVNLLAGLEKDVEQTDFILAPLFDVGKKLPSVPGIITERYASVPVSLTSYKNEKGEKITSGVAMDASMATTDWVVEENTRFGLGIKGPNGGVMPSIAAPLQGKPESLMKPGDSYSFTYKLLETDTDWFETFSHVVTDIYGLTDYRQNYYGGLTDTVLNTTKLALDPVYSGWDKGMMLHYNIEGKYSASQANPMVYLSSYLLSENEEMLTERAIPSIAYLLTRTGLHFTRSDVKGTGNPGLVFDNATAVGNPTRSFGTSVLGGVYQMSRGYNDVFKELGYANGPVYYNAYGSTPKFTEYAWAYRYTGNAEYLKIAKEEADKFIENNITNPMQNHPDYSSFIAISYYPNFQALLDLYEICGDKKYLDAAVQGAEMMLATVWVSPVPEKDMTISADKIREEHFAKGDMNANYYYDKAWRIGYPENLEKLQDETVPFWLVSRTGLSIEQASTYKQHNSGNMIMANWASDLMRLYSYTKNPIFETYARNAVIGRYTNYPGYYYNQYHTTAMKPNYPYEGPDISGIYWHHIPPFLSMAQDFLFTQAIAWSDRKIDFPSIRQQGYAYFSSREYGMEAGKVFDLNDMWLWLKEGLIAEDNLQVDWFAARKDGTAAFVFMNEGKQEETFTFRLGSEIAGGAFTGDVAVYDSQGNKTSGRMENGVCTLTVPAHSLVAVALNDSSVTAPAYSKANMESKKGQTSVQADANGLGAGYLLQVTPNISHAYLYTTFTTKDVSKVVFHYKDESGAWQKVEKTEYPFETIIKSGKADAPFVYYVEKFDLSGASTRSEEKTLIPKQ